LLLAGLDARSAQIVMRVVRNIVNNKRTIACTIHQPSAEIFLGFDELLLLKRGGWPIYCGPLGHECRTLVEYFESVPNAMKLRSGYNPATFMLEVTTHAMYMSYACGPAVSLHLRMHKIIY
jgi:ABC-type multidrug transport system ATPase subunit